MQVQRNHTRSRSFKLTRLWRNSSSGSDDPNKPTTPATPGTFNYYAVNDPGAEQAYDAYASRHAAYDTPSTLTFPDERDSDEESSDDFDDGDVRQRRRRVPEDRGDVAQIPPVIILPPVEHEERQRRSAAARDLQLPTRTPKETKRKKSKNCCAEFCQRFSFLMFFAFLLCCTGGCLFAVCLKLVADDMMQMQQEVFHISRPWMEGASIGLTAAGALMVALSALIFALSFVFWPKSSSEGNSKESMRNRRFSQVRPASKTPPLVLMCMLYPALPVWMFFVAVSVAFHMCSWILDGVCHTEEILPLWDGTVEPTNGEQCETILEGEDCVDCIDLYQFHFLFPSDTRKEDMWICGTEIELFCGTDLPDIVRYWLLCCVGSVLVVLGVCLHLLMLTHERTRLGEERLAQEEKALQEEKDLRYIQNRVSHALLTASAGSLNNNGSKSSSKKKKKLSKAEKKRRLQAGNNGAE